MIHQFDKKKRVLFFPTAWANSVAAWCGGVSSPKGTISIKNTMTPKEGGASLEIDVNEERIKSLALTAVSNRTDFSETEKQLLKGILRGSADQKVLVYRNDIFSIDMDALRRNLDLQNIALQENQTDASTAGQAYDISTAEKLAQLKPKNVGSKEESQESDTERIARIGVSLRAAREDHQHPLNVDVDAQGGYIKQIVKNGEAIPFGSSTKYARADHTHDLPELTADDIWYSGNVSVGDEIDEVISVTNNHEGRITTLEKAKPPSTGVTSVNGKTGAVTLGADDIPYSAGVSVGDGLDDYFQYFANPLDSKAANIPVLTDGSGGVKANTVTADANNNRYYRVAKNSTGAVTLGTIPAADITDANCTSGGDCIAYFDKNKHLAHLGNAGITVSKLQIIDQVFDWTKSGSVATDGVLNYLAFGASAKPTKKKLVVFAANASAASLEDYLVANLQVNAVDTTKTEWNTQAKVAAAAPKPTRALLIGEYSGGAETNASKIARIGTSAYAAREDHTHPIEHDTTAVIDITLPWSTANDSGTWGHKLDNGANNGWTRNSTVYATVTSSGDNKTVTPASPARYCGVKFKVITRIVRAAMFDYFICRELEFDKNGMLRKLGPELAVYGQYNCTM